MTSSILIILVASGPTGLGTRFLVRQVKSLIARLTIPSSLGQPSHTNSTILGASFTSGLVNVVEPPGITTCTNQRISASNTALWASHANTGC